MDEGSSQPERIRLTSTVQSNNSSDNKISSTPPPPPPLPLEKFNNNCQIVTKVFMKKEITRN